MPPRKKPGKITLTMEQRLDMMGAAFTRKLQVQENEIKALKEEAKDLRQAHLILVERHDNIHRLVERACAETRELTGRHESLRQQVSALANRQDHPLDCDETRPAPSSRLADIENRITALEGSPFATIRQTMLSVSHRDKQLAELEERVAELEDEAGASLLARIANLENNDLLTEQRLHKLEGGKGLEPPAPVVKGGWLNVYRLFPDGRPDTDQCVGPFPDRGTADNCARTDEAEGRKRIACLYLHGNDGEIEDEVRR